MTTFKKSILTIFLAFLLTNCATPVPFEFESLSEKRPQLIQLNPDLTEKILSNLDHLEITFSQSIDPQSLTASSILILEGELPPFKYPDFSTLEKALEKETLKPILGNLALGSSTTQVLWTPLSPLPPASYTLVISPKLQSTQHLPFTPSPGQPLLFLQKTFKLIAVQSAPETVVTLPQPASGSVASIPSPKTSTTSSLPLDSLSETKPNVETNPIPPALRPDSIHLNEILYDAIPSDTDGYEFVELYGTPNRNIGGYQIVFINGEDGKILKTITFPDGSMLSSEGLFVIADSQTNALTQSRVASANWIENFDPQNGPDAVQLLNEEGQLLDALSYGIGGLPIASNGLATGYGTPAPDVKEGHSLSRQEGVNTNDNAKDFIELSEPTPGKL